MGQAFRQLGLEDLLDNVPVPGQRWSMASVLKSWEIFRTFHWWMYQTRWDINQLKHHDEGPFFYCVPKCGENSLPNICTPGSGIGIDCSRERPLPSDFPHQGHEALPGESHKAGGDKKPAPFGSENLPFFFKWSILQLNYGNYLQLFPEYHAWLSILLKCTTVVSRSRASHFGVPRLTN